MPDDDCNDALLVSILAKAQKYSDNLAKLAREQGITSNVKPRSLIDLVIALIDIGAIMVEGDELKPCTEQMKGRRVRKYLASARRHYGVAPTRHGMWVVIAEPEIVSEPMSLTDAVYVQNTLNRMPLDNTRTSVYYKRNKGKVKEDDR